MKYLHWNRPEEYVQAYIKAVNGNVKVAYEVMKQFKPAEETPDNMKFYRAVLARLNELLKH